MAPVAPSAIAIAAANLVILSQLLMQASSYAPSDHAGWRISSVAASDENLLAFSFQVNGFIETTIAFLVWG
jgi:hypothetical protein